MKAMFTTVDKLTLLSCEFCYHRIENLPAF